MMSESYSSFLGPGRGMAASRCSTETPRERDPTSMNAKGSSRDEARFELPPEVSLAKERLADGWAYVFRHRSLGLLGRILLQDTGDGRSRVTCELAGDPADPMTARRAEVFKPLGLELAHRLESQMGSVPEALAAPPPPQPPPSREVVESQVIPCDRCGRVVAMLIFAPEATDPGRFEDCARKMFAEYSRMNVPTWVIGPSLGEGPPEDRPAGILKVWPTRAPVERLRPAEFNPIIERLATGHCLRLRRVVSGGQTGADQAGVPAGPAAGVGTRGGGAPGGGGAEWRPDRGRPGGVTGGPGRGDGDRRVGTARLGDRGGAGPVARRVRAQSMPEEGLSGPDRGERPRLRRDALVRQHGLAGLSGDHRRLPEARQVLPHRRGGGHPAERCRRLACRPPGRGPEHRG